MVGPSVVIAAAEITSYYLLQRLQVPLVHVLFYFLCHRTIKGMESSIQMD